VVSKVVGSLSVFRSPLYGKSRVLSNPLSEVIEHAAERDRHGPKSRRNPLDAYGTVAPTSQSLTAP
jgi:hypothetical protein